jgi:hypothetical protein
VFVIAFPLAAQSSAQGSFNFKGTEGLQAIEFTALGDERSADGYFTLTGPTLVSDGDLNGEDPKQTSLASDFTMKVKVDCMSAIGNRVTMGGTISDSSVRSMIGRIAMLTVEDNDLNKEDPTDRFTFGSYWEKDISWFPTDDVGYKISRTHQVNCHSFPVALYDLDPISEGRITVVNK